MQRGSSLILLSILCGLGGPSVFLPIQVSRSGVRLWNSLLLSLI